MLKRGGTNRQHDDKHRDHGDDDGEEGASQQRPQQCGDVTLVTEPVSLLAFLTSRLEIPWDLDQEGLFIARNPTMA